MRLQVFMKIKECHSSTKSRKYWLDMKTMMSATIRHILIFSMVIANVLATPVESKHEDIDDLKQCIDEIKQWRNTLDPAVLAKLCKNKAEWLKAAASWNNNQHSSYKVNAAQVEFMKSLSGKPDFTEQLKQMSVKANDWPYVSPLAKPRKEYRMLSDEERHRYHNAVNVLKSFYIDDKHNIYDTMVQFHFVETSPSAHYGPNFLGWHREFLYRMEQTLQLVDPDVTIPYWDTRMDSVLGDDAAYTMMFTEDFMGNRFGDVVTGPFGNWRLVRPINDREYLYRSDSVRGHLIGDEEYNYIVALNNFRNLTFNVDGSFELDHGLNHVWIGGLMADGFSDSPGEPMFFLHHCFIDFIWYQQQKRVFREIGRQDYFYPRDDDLEAYGVGTPEFPYLNETVLEPKDSHHYYNNPMWPFDDKKNYEGLSDFYFRYSYYEDSPTCSAEAPSCGSPYLFCIQVNSKCVPKLQKGANCAEFSEYDSCYNGQCTDGVCAALK